MLETFFSAEITPQMSFLDHESNFWALEIRNLCQFSPKSIENALLKWLGSTLPPRTVGGIDYTV